ncbi:MAG: hypothetical protein M9958_10945 [Chitinophagales bacterium]|nr:hypothetical protein [Chitinophagales bacterium]
MRFLFFFILLTTFYGYAFAQEADGGCNTEDADSAIVVSFPWYGNNEFLLDWVDSIPKN